MNINNLAIYRPTIIKAIENTAASPRITRYFISNKFAFKWSAAGLTNVPEAMIRHQPVDRVRQATHITVNTLTLICSRRHVIIQLMTSSELRMRAAGRICCTGSPYLPLHGATLSAFLPCDES